MRVSIVFMKKTINQRLLTKRKVKSSRFAKNKVLFVVNQSEIEEAIHSGWPLRGIFELLKSEEKLDCSYSTFCRHVKEFINTKGKPTSKRTSPNTTNKGSIKEFVYDPTPKDIEEFI